MKRRLVGGCLAAVVATVAILPAASPTSGTLTAGTTVQWNGTAGVSAAPAEGELTCVDGTNCDVFTLKVPAGNYVGKRVRFKVSWGNEAKAIDVYVDRQSAPRPQAHGAANRKPVEGNTLHPQAERPHGAHAPFVS